MMYIESGKINVIIHIIWNIYMSILKNKFKSFNIEFVNTTVSVYFAFFETIFSKFSDLKVKLLKNTNNKLNKVTSRFESIDYLW